MAKKILVIEDEKVLSDVLRVKIEKEGYEVLVAYDGKEGYKQIKEWKPDLILLDILLPKMDGYEILENLKKEKIKTPVLVISNSGQPVEMEETKKLGAVDSLVKAQFEPAEVISKLRHYLGEPEKKVEAKPVTPGNIIKVLLIEDDKFLRSICMKKLAKEEFEIMEASDGEEALKLLETKVSDIILLDIVLPSMDGFEVLSKIKSHSNPEVAKVPVLMLSNLGQDEDVKKALDLGANDYLIKANFTTQEIVEKIRSTMKE